MGRLAKSKTFEIANFLEHFYLCDVPSYEQLVQMGKMCSPSSS